MTNEQLVEKLKQYPLQDDVFLEYPMGGVFRTIQEKDITTGKGCVYLTIKSDDELYDELYEEQAIVNNINTGGIK